MSDKEMNQIRKKCFAFCSTLAKRECNFSFTLKLGQSFTFSLVSSEQSAPRARRRPPSYTKRQQRRRAAFLERKAEQSPEEATRVGSSPVQEDTAIRKCPGQKGKNNDNLDSKSPQAKFSFACPLNLDPDSAGDTGRAEGSVDADGGTEEPKQGTRKFDGFQLEAQTGDQTFYKTIDESETYDENYQGCLRRYCNACQEECFYNKYEEDKDPAICLICDKILPFE